MTEILIDPEDENWAFTEEDWALIEVVPEAPLELWAYWNDPDDGFCSGPVKVLGSEGDHVIVERDGSTFEVFDDELIYSPQDGIFYG